MNNFESMDLNQQIAALKLLVKKALPMWGIKKNELQLIKHRENTVFSLDCELGKFAVRVHRNGYHSDRELLGELEWISHLRDSSINVPEILKSQSGHYFETVTHEDVSGSRQIDILHWLEGEPIGTIEGIIGGDINKESALKNYHLAGELAAKLHNQSKNFTFSESASCQRWDSEGLFGESANWGNPLECELLSNDERALLELTIKQLKVELEHFGQHNTNFGLLHCDFVPENIFTEGNNLSIIDFDDFGYGWHLFEIATALFFFADEPIFDDLLTNFISGYRQYRELSGEHLALLPMFFLIRGLVYIGWIETRKDTETAKELGPVVKNAVCEMAKQYIQQ